MTSAHGAREPQLAALDSAEQSVRRHRAGGGGSRRGSSRPQRSRPVAVTLIPTACAAVLAVIAVAVVVHGTSPSPLRGGTLVTVWILGALLVLVVLAGAAMASMTGTATEAPAPGTNLLQPAFEERPLREMREPDENPATPASAGEDVFVHLSRRLQSLVHRQIELLDRLENEVEEPDLLKGLFNIDHLATRMRRHAENLAVLGGAVPRRQWTKPISVMEILRSAVSETLDYARVQVVPRTPGSINGYAVADIVHLLAELVENATTYSPPDTKVVIRAQAVTAGLAIEIDDRGLGMRPEEYERLNALLREPADISVQELLQGARIGLYVVAQLARRHGIAVQLQPNITGGIQALVVLPRMLLATAELRPGGQQQQTQAPPSPQQQQRPQPPRPATPQQPAPAAPSPNPPRFGPLAPQQPQAPTRTEPRPQGTNGVTVGGMEQPDQRPPLPRRHPQQHLAAPLLDVTPEHPRQEAEPEIATPHLMADFRRGLTEGAAAPPPNRTASDGIPTQEDGT